MPQGKLRPPTILIVEDEPLIRMFAADIAEESGFPVIEAANARDALAAIEQHASIGIVFTDIRMPGEMDGLSLAHAVRQARPDIRFIVVSGHRKVQPEELPSKSLFFSKPYMASEIIEALQGLAEDWRAREVQ